MTGSFLNVPNHDSTVRLHIRPLKQKKNGKTKSYCETKKKVKLLKIRIKKNMSWIRWLMNWKWSQIKSHFFQKRVINKTLHQILKTPIMCSKTKNSFRDRIKEQWMKIKRSKRTLIFYLYFARFSPLQYSSFDCNLFSSIVYIKSHAWARVGPELIIISPHYQM